MIPTRKEVVVLMKSMVNKKVRTLSQRQNPPLLSSFEHCFPIKISGPETEKEGEELCSLIVDVAPYLTNHDWTTPKSLVGSFTITVQCYFQAFHTTVAASFCVT